MKFSGLDRKAKTIVVVALTILILGFSGSVSASGGGHEEAASKGWVATDTYRVMNFTLLAVLLFFILRKPASAALNDRIQGIQDQLEELESKKAGAEKTLAEYEEKIAALDKEAEQIVAEYVRQGEEARKRILAEAEKSAEKLEGQALRNIEYEFKKAKTELQDDLIAKALVKAEEMLKSKITSEDQDRLVDDYLNKVVAS